MRTAARVLVTVLPLLAVGLACGQASPTLVGNVVPVTAITLPPAWTPTWNGQPSAVPGWVLVAGNGVELWLPGEYDGGDPVGRAQEMADLLSTMPGYADMAEAVRQNPEGFRLLAVDDTSGSILGVSLKEVPPDMPMSEYVDAWSQAVVDLTPGSSVVEKRVVQFRNGDAGRAILEFNVQGSFSWQLSYILRREEQIWTFNFGAAKEDFYQLQPIFEQCMQTVSFLP